MYNSPLSATAAPLASLTRKPKNVSGRRPYAGSGSSRSCQSSNPMGAITAST